MTIRLGDPAAGIVLGRDTIDPGLDGLPAALRESVLWLDSRYSKAGEPRVINRGTGDRTAVSGAVIYNGAVVLPGTAGNYLSTPDEAALDITGDQEFVARVSLDDWTPASLATILSTKPSGLSGYELDVNTDGRLIIGWGSGAEGATNGFVYSSTAPTLTNGTTYWIKATLDINNGAGGFDVKFYTAPDQATEPTSWTQVGATVTNAGTAVPSVSSTPLVIGARSQTLDRRLVGTVKRIIVRDGIDGTTVLDVDLSTVNNWAGSFTATTGQTVTLNTTAAKFGAPSALDAKYGSVLGAYVYDGAAVLPGLTGNYLSTPDAPDQSGFTEMEIVVRLAPDDWTPVTTQTIIGKRTAGVGDLSFGLSLQSTGVVLGVSSDGTTWASIATVLPAASMTHLVNGEASWLKVTWDGASSGPVGQTFTYTAPDQPTEPTSWATSHAGSSFAVGATTHDSAEPIRIGTHAGTAEMFAGSIYRTIVRDGIDGTTVLDVDLTNVADYATSFTATTGQTVTVNSTSSDTNDPLLLTHTGENYVYLSGTSSNFLSVPDEAALDITGDLELIVDCAVPDWTPSANLYILSKHGGGSTGGFELQLNLGLGLILNYADSGVGSYMQCPSPLPFANGERGAIKVTFDVDDGAGNRVARFYTADTAAGPWTLLGTDTDVGTVTLDTNALPLCVGSRTTATTQGYYYNAIVKDGIDGTTVFEFNAATDITDAGATSLTASSGQTVTVNRATSGRKTALVTRPVWLFGTDDMFRIEDNALLDFDAATDSTILVVRRSHATLPASAGILQKVNTVSPFPSYAIRSGGSDPEQLVTTVKDTAGAAPSGGGANSTTNQIIYGDLQVLGQLRDRSVPEHKALINNTIYGAVADDTNGDLSNNGPLNIGVSDSVYADQELVAVAVWRRVLTTDEIAAINTYYSTGA